MNDLHAQLQRASACLQQADPGSCRRICDTLLERLPGLWEARHLRGLAAVQTGDTAAALHDLGAVHRAQPANAHAAFWLGRLLRQAGRYDEALAPLQAAARDPAQEIDARYELARTLTRLRRSEDAETEYRRLLARSPGHADAAANLAFLLERRNRMEDAAEWVDRALAGQPGNFMAGLTKAALERRTGSPDAARQRLDTLLAAAEGPLNRSIVLYQLGQCLDQMGDWRNAFDRFREANAILRDEHPHGRPEEDGSYGLRTLDRLRTWLSRHPVAGWTDNPHASASDPVFLVGFPRSGTTLLDQVLSAHPDIEVCEEHELFDQVRRAWVDGDRYRRLGSMRPSELADARSTYLRALARQRRDQARKLVVDKLPLNLAYLFLIHRLFPRSPVILALRDPRDACLSCFFQSFELQGPMPYFLDLHQTARYYDEVMGLATETLAQTGNPVCRVKYEETVGGLERQARSLIAFLGLPWHDAVLDYRRTARARIIDTPSYQQVVQPLYTSSIGRWRHYRGFMEPVLDILGPWVERFGYA